MADIYTSSGVLTTTVLAEWIRRQALDPLQEVVVIAPHVAQYDASGANTKSYSVPILPSLTASTVGETADLTSTAYTPTEISITPGEVGLMTIVTDLGSQTSVLNDVGGLFASQAGMAIGRKIDTDLAALFGALNGGTAIGTSGSAPTVAQFMSCIYTMELANVQGPINAFLAPLQVSGLRSAAAASDKTTAAEFALKRAEASGFVDNMFGVDVYQTTVLATANGATGDFVGCLLATGGECGLAMALWSDVRSELQRDASRRGTEVVVVSTYGTKEQRDAGGVPWTTS